MSEGARALLFDLDDTLIDGRATQAAIGQTCEALAVGAGVGSHALLEANREAWQAYWPLVEEDWTMGRLPSDELSREVWRRALAMCGFDDPALVQLARETHLRLARAALRLFDDVLELFEALPAGVGLGLITNGASDTQRGALRALGIEDRFGAIVISAEDGVAKPDVPAFRLACERLGVPAAHAWHVGDSLRTDVAGARAAGLTAVWLNRFGAFRTSTDAVPHHEIRSLIELPALLSAG